MYHESGEARLVLVYDESGEARLVLVYDESGVTGHVTDGVFVTQGMGRGRSLGLVTMVTRRLERHHQTVQRPQNLLFSSIILIKCNITML